MAGKKKGTTRKTGKKSGRGMRDLEVKGVRGGAGSVKGGARQKVKQY